MNRPAHDTIGANRTQTMRFYPFVFTGKERDKETGYGYLPRQARQAHHGARYMDHELMTMWLSVDPLADKYPSISPYAYCTWNPVKLVDPDGMDTIVSINTKKPTRTRITGRGDLGTARKLIVLAPSDLLLAENGKETVDNNGKWNVYKGGKLVKQYEGFGFISTYETVNTLTK